MKKKHNKKNPLPAKSNSTKVKVNPATSVKQIDETSKNETETIGKKIYKYVMGLS